MSALSMLSAEALAELVGLVADEVERRQLSNALESSSAGRWMTVAESAEYLRCDEQRIRNLRSARRLTPHREGGRALCDRAEVENLVGEA